MPPVLQLSDIRLTFGGTPLLEGATLAAGPGDRIALVGRNGSGKSTLLKIAAGLIQPDSGVVFRDPAARIAFLAQDSDFSAYETVRDFAVAELEPEASAHPVETILSDLGVDPDAATATLSGGEARRAGLARALAGAPDLLLLDEPTNHLDIAAIEWLETRLRSSGGALVVISHDRRFLEKLTNRTVWIDRGAARALDAGFSSFESWRDRLIEDDETAAHKLDRKIVAEEHWVRFGVTARRKRNMRRMRELDALRASRRDARKRQGGVEFSVAEGATSGRRAILARGVTKSFGARAIVSDLDLVIARGDRLGIVGPNGAGKTTLLNVLTGTLPPDSGEVVLGSNLQIISLDQRRRALDPEMRVADAITDGRGDYVEINGARRHAATYLKDFLFSAEQFRSPVRALSGGEKARLALAAALAKPSNFLVLDEPTNDLDLETLELLEEMIADYPGTALVVSHDRAFLDRISTSILAPSPERDGRWVEYVGGYSDMLAQREADPVGKPLAGAKAPRDPARPREPPPSGVAAKLSYKEKFALERLPAKIDALAAEVAALRSALADPALFSRDAARFNAKAARLEAAEAELADAEAEWLTLEMKREESGRS